MKEIWNLNQTSWLQSMATMGWRDLHFSVKYLGIWNTVSRSLQQSVVNMSSRVLHVCSLCIWTHLLLPSLWSMKQEKTSLVKEATSFLKLEHRSLSTSTSVIEIVVWEVGYPFPSLSFLCFSSQMSFHFSSVLVYFFSRHTSTKCLTRLYLPCYLLD